MYTSIALLTAFAAAASSQSLSAALADQSDLSQLTTYLEDAGLLESLQGLEGITIFAPTNEAFQEVLDEFPSLANGNDGVSMQLQNILQYHVVAGGTYLSTDILEYPGNFLDSAYDNRVVNPFYGDNEGSGVYSAEKRLSTINQADLEYDNGVVHIIDRVMIPPTPANQTALDMGFLYFAGAVSQLDLVEDIISAEEVTLFIPMDSAFIDVGSAISDLSTSELNTLIQYHAVVGEVRTSLDLSDDSTLETLSGDELEFTVNESDGGLYVNNARVITPNILLANGVAHLIDQVLNPSDEYEYTLDYEESEGVPAFEDADNSEIPALTSGLPTPTNAFEPTATFSAVSGASNVQSQGVFAGLFALVAIVAFAV